MPARRFATLRRSARVGWYVGLGLLVGALVWGWLMPPREPGSAPRRVIHRYVRRFVVAGWALLLAATTARVALLLASLTTVSPGTGLSTIVGRLRPTVAGRAWFVVFDVAVLAAVLVRRDARRWLAATAVVLAVGEAATGHAAVGPHPLVATASVSLHLLALAVWGGGLFLLGPLLVSRAWRAAPAYQRQAVINQFLRRFSQLALGAVALLFVTGVGHGVDSARRRRRAHVVELRPHAACEARAHRRGVAARRVALAGRARPGTARAASPRARGTLARTTIIEGAVVPRWWSSRRCWRRGRPAGWMRPGLVGRQRRPTTPTRAAKRPSRPTSAGSVISRTSLTPRGQDGAVSELRLAAKPARSPSASATS